MITVDARPAQVNTGSTQTRPNGRAAISNPDNGGAEGRLQSAQTNNRETASPPETRIEGPAVLPWRQSKQSMLQWLKVPGVSGGGSDGALAFIRTREDELDIGVVALLWLSG